MGFGEWIDINTELPPFNTLVKVLLTNGCESFDFVNEPLNSGMPFQHYIVTNWRMPTTQELNGFMRRANQSPERN